MTISLISIASGTPVRRESLILLPLVILIIFNFILIIVDSFYYDMKDNSV
jgi:hypothetical protein